MTNTREEVAMLGVRPSYNAAFAENARFNTKFHESLDWELERARQSGFEAGYHAGSKYLPQLVAALKAIKQHQEMNVKSNTTALMGTTWHIAEKALNSLPDEVKQ